MRNGCADVFALVYTCRKTGLAASLVLTGCLFSASLLGCRSPYVQTTVINAGKVELRNIEVDYPSASFGISSLAPGAEFHYRFSIQDAGRMKVQFSDSAEQSHTAKGPYVSQGQQGTLQLTLDDSGAATWKIQLQPNMPHPGDAGGN